jgi:hypothetical protein
MMRYAKYGNIKVEYDGRRFDSIAEKNRYVELTLLLAAGEISELICQPKYELIPAFVDAVGNRQRNVIYTPDFRYKENGRIVCEDVKGVLTDASQLRMKLFRWRYPTVELRVIKV